VGGGSGWRWPRVRCRAAPHSPTYNGAGALARRGSQASQAASLATSRRALQPAAVVGRWDTWTTVPLAREAARFLAARPLRWSCQM